MKGGRGLGVGRGKENRASNYELLEDGNAKKESKGNSITILELLAILKPYFWPNAATDGAWINRLRAISTWLMVGLSKAASLMAPLYLAVATNDLVVSNLSGSFVNIVIYCSLRLFSSIFKGIYL